MHVITRKRLQEFWAIHAQAKGPLEKWHSTVSRARWTCFDDVKRTYNSADVVGDFVVFNVNSFRIIATVRFQYGRVFISKVMTHSEYDKWKS